MTILGGLFWSARVTSDIVFGRGEGEGSVADGLSFLIPLLLLAGLGGLYVRCRGRLGEWAWISRMAATVGALGLVGASAGLIGDGRPGLSWWSEMSSWMFGFGLFMLSLGMLFLGNAILQKGLLGRWKVLPVGIGALGILCILIPFWTPAGVVLWALYGLAWVLLGYTLLAERSEPARRAAPVR